MAVTSIRTYVWVCLAILAAVVVAVRIGTTRSAAKAIRPQMLSEPTRQPRQLRVEDLGLRDATHGSVTPTEPPSVTLRRPPYVEVSDHDGHLFLYDDDHVLEYSPEGQLVQALEQQGLPKVKSISHLAVYADRVWATDLLGKAVHVFDRSTRSWSTTKTDFEPYRAEPSRDRQRLLVLRVGAPQLFTIVDASGRQVESFGDLLANQKAASLALDGTVTRTGSAIVLAPLRLGVLASFTEQGRLNWLVESIAPPPPPVVVTRRNTTFVDREPLPAAISLASTDDEILVMTRRTQSLRTDAFVDLYNAVDGTYYRSLRLAEGRRWYSVAVGGQYLFVSQYDGLFRWPRSVLDQQVPRREVLGAGERVVRYVINGGVR